MFNAIRNLVLLMGRELNYSVQQRKNFERQNGGKGTSKMKNWGEISKIPQFYGVQ